MHLAQKTKAAELAIALTLGFAKLPEATEWVDEQILIADVPDDTLFDLSLATGLSEAAGYLRALSAGTDRWRNLAYFLSRFHAITSMHSRDASILAKYLYMTTHRNHLQTLPAIQTRLV